MDILSNLATGAEVALSPAALGFCLLGVLLGTLIGILPGLGPTTTIAILLPFTYNLGPAISIIMLAGIYYGAQYGGSTTAILVNLPGEASSVVTALDGYQLARQGRAGTALAVAALSSFFAGTFGTLVLAIFAPPLTRLALNFGSADYCGLMLFALIGAVVLSGGSVLRSVLLAVLGLLLGLVGPDAETGQPRLTFGIPELADGIGFVVVATGLFGIAEIIHNLASRDDRAAGTQKIGRLMPEQSELAATTRAAARGSVVGSLFGVLPGGGPALSSFIAYFVEKKFARDPSRFGRGAIEGVAAPEAANNAAAQTSFIPMLTLGIPSNSVMALMIGAMIIQGIQPGPLVLTKQPELFWGIIVSMWVGNVMLLILNLPMVGLWARLLNVPYALLYPPIILFCCIGVYSVGNSVVDVFLTAFFGVVGFVLRRLGCEVMPLVLGFVLGPMIEENFRRALMLSQGDFATFVQRPISLGFLAAAAVLLVAVALPRIRTRRQAVSTEE